MSNIDLVAVLAAAITVAMLVGIYALLIAEWRGPA
jgi:hypothetical protein